MSKRYYIRKLKSVLFALFVGYETTNVYLFIVLINGTIGIPFVESLNVSVFKRSVRCHGAQKGWDIRTIH